MSKIIHKKNILVRLSTKGMKNAQNTASNQDKQSKKKKQLPYAQALGIARLPIKKVLSSQGRGSPEMKLEKIIGKDGVSAFNFALSPGDFECTVGLPDGAMPRSIPLTLKTDFVMSTTTTNATWNLAILTLPSIDFPCICVGYQPGSFPWQFFGSFANVTGIASNITENADTTMRNWSGTNYSVYIPQWSATTLDYMRGPTVSYNAGNPNFTAPAGWPTMTVYNNDGSLISSSAVKGFLGIGTTQSSAIQAWRCCGMSATCTLSASAIADEGMVSSRPLSRVARQGLTTINMQAVNDYASGTGSSYASSYVSCPAFSLDNLPESRADLVSAEQTYNNKAKAGSYVVSHYVGGAKTFLDTDVDRGILALSSYQPRVGGDEQDAAFAAAWPVYPKLNQGASTTAAPAVIGAPIVLGVDQNWTPTMTIFEGIDKTATVDVKLVMGVQCTATNSGAYASVGKVVAQPSLMFSQVLSSTMKVLPPAVPSDENWEWADVGRWIKTALEVVIGVAPFLLPLL